MYTLESQMAAPVIEWLRSQGMLVKQEFVLPWGICDLVGCLPNKELVDARMSLGQTSSLGGHENVLLLSMIPDESKKQGITLKKLESIYFKGTTNVRERLQPLIRNRFVIETETGSFKSRSSWKPLHQDLIAVELKLSRIREALSQAISHQGFTLNSYVALPDEVATRAHSGRWRSIFEESGVGLIAVSQETCKTLIHANGQEDRLDPVRQLHAAEKFWPLIKKDIAASAA